MSFLEVTRRAPRGMTIGQTLGGMTLLLPHEMTIKTGKKFNSEKIYFFFIFLLAITKQL